MDPDTSATPERNPERDPDSSLNSAVAAEDWKGVEGVDFFSLYNKDGVLIERFPAHRRGDSAKFHTPLHAIR